MEESFRETVAAALKAKGLNQSQLATQLGRERASISRTLGRSPIDPRSDWPAILDALGLEVVIRPRRGK